MTPFADLLSGLVFTPGRNAKLRLLQRYFEQTPDPDRGWALAAIAETLELRGVKPALIRALIEARVDPVLFRLSYDYVGDLAETVSLIWPRAGAAADAAPRLTEVVGALAATGRAEAPALLATLLDRLGPNERFALIKLATGGLRVGVSARMAKTALSLFAESRGVTAPLETIEALWHGLTPPYADLFAWLSGAAPAPEVDLALAFRPMMLAQPLDPALETPAALAGKLAPEEHAAEWKWDGIRVQAIGSGGAARLYSRAGEEIGAAFPDVLESLTAPGCVDGELLIGEGDRVAPFSELQKRLGRKTAPAKLLREAPAFIRAYDLLQDGAEDLRDLPFRERRARLEAWLARWRPARIDLSPLIPFADWEGLCDLRAGARAASQEGLMLKRWDSRYEGGRPTGPWWKWKRDPLSADCVLLYAQRGHGKRSSYYSDYTFGAWRDGAEGPELTPVAKAYSGYTDAELRRLDRWIRDNTTERFGPVRAVRPELVFELAFDAVQASTRRKSGIAMRFPRIKRIRWDKPAAEADRLATLEAMIPGAVETDSS